MLDVVSSLVCRWISRVGCAGRLDDGGGRRSGVGLKRVKERFEGGY
jgi:hypothetical protein